MKSFPLLPHSLAFARTITLALPLAALGGLACSSSATPGGTGGTGGSASGGSGGTGGTSGTGGSGGAGGSVGGDAGPGGSDGSGTGGAGSGGSGGPGTGGGQGTGTGGSSGRGVDGGAADAAAGDGGAFVLSSSAFQNDGVIDPKYRCLTANLSPPLSWTPGPAGTQSYAVTMNHNAALHWLLWDIPVSITSLPEAVARMAMPPVPAGSKQNMTGTDKASWYGYTGPCPGGTTNGGTFTDYPFTVYALNVATLPGVTPQSKSAEIKAAIDAATLKIGTATLNAKAGGGK
jgi:Raf kinase inhibitor-like YbhB/YbcL family protein